MLDVIAMFILAGVNMHHVTMSTFNNIIHNSTIQLVLSSIGFQNLLCRVQLAGGKPKVFRLIISDPFDQALHFLTNNTVLLDSLDFIVFFTIDF